MNKMKKKMFFDRMGLIGSTLSLSLERTEFDWTPSYTHVKCLSYFKGGISYMTISEHEQHIKFCEYMDYMKEKPYEFSKDFEEEYE